MHHFERDPGLVGNGLHGGEERGHPSVLRGLGGVHVELVAGADRVQAQSDLDVGNDVGVGVRQPVLGPREVEVPGRREDEQQVRRALGTGDRVEAVEHARELQERHHPRAVGIRTNREVGGDGRSVIVSDNGDGGGLLVAGEALPRDPTLEVRHTHLRLLARSLPILRNKLGVPRAPLHSCDKRCRLLVRKREEHRGLHLLLSKSLLDRAPLGPRLAAHAREIRGQNDHETPCGALVEQLVEQLGGDLIKVEHDGLPVQVALASSRDRELAERRRARSQLLAIAVVLDHAVRIELQNIALSADRNGAQA
mmetsp:Transcript_13508/g.32819  ORF Transcript_13508/g.32819 Transcript_13508/m.32819 type:complete len:309 (+) Transcript_13508:715-1641(+)